MRVEDLIVSKLDSLDAKVDGIATQVSALQATQAVHTERVRKIGDTVERYKSGSWKLLLALIGVLGGGAWGVNQATKADIIETINPNAK